MGEILILLIIVGVTYVTGTIIEKRHYKDIIKREIALIKKPIINAGAKTWNSKKKIKKIELVTGEVVISGDYFKNFAATLKSFFGGRLTSFESVLDRGRREAILRMRENAKDANFIINARIESVMINDYYTNNSVPQCAIIAYGTAITYE
ncbi:TPA: heavy metal-binding domain-containing protein [Candidatus Galligastranaerophilus intestinigallinarum]|nr:heavy metal-binding domain-containing protein [Candidatus Galligastranaerophilus intestinigallinarum]